MLHRLKTDHRLAELPAGPRVSERLVHRSLRDAERLRGHSGTGDIEGGLSDQEPAAFTANQVLFGDLAVIKLELVGR